MRYFYKLKDDYIDENSIPVFPYTSIASDFTPSQLRSKYVQEQSTVTPNSYTNNDISHNNTTTDITNNECFKDIGSHDGTDCGDYSDCLQAFNCIPYTRCIENTPVPLQIAYPDNLYEYDEF